MFTIDIANIVRRTLTVAYKALLNPIPYLIALGVTVSGILTQYADEWLVNAISDKFSMPFYNSFGSVGSEFFQLVCYSCSLDVALSLIEWTFRGISALFVFAGSSFVIYFCACMIYRAAMATRSTTMSIIPR